VLVAIGANLPGPDGESPLENCRRAAAALDALHGMRLVALSRWWVSAPIPPSGQPDYVNGVARLAGQISPEALLAALQALERQAGRRRPEAPNAARPLDLDIIAMGRLVRAGPDPILPRGRARLAAPHPRPDSRSPARFAAAPAAEPARSIGRKELYHLARLRGWDRINILNIKDKFCKPASS